MDEILMLYGELHELLGTHELCAGFCEKIIQVIQDAVDKIPFGSRVGIRCADPCMEYIFNKIDFSRTNVIGVFDLRREGSFCGYPLFLSEKLPEMNCDYVLFATYTYRDAVLRELSSFPGIILDVYSLLDEHGITLRGPIKFYQMGCPMVLNHFYLKYAEERQRILEEKTLRDCLQAAIEYKDFVLVSEIYKDNGGEQSKYPILAEVWERTQHILRSIQKQINGREEKDIAAFWIDSMDYSDLDNMPLLKNKAENGCFFEKTYANCPWTRPTMQTIFQGVLPIEGFSNERKAINHSNSPMISYLEDNGYEVRWASFPTWSMDSEYTVPQIVEGMSSSVIWWQGLQSMLRSKKPCFYVFHFFVEGHEPMLSPNMTEFHFSSPHLHLQSAQIEEQRKKALSYLEQCLMLWSQLLESKTQIFFSDHGPSYPNIPNWSEKRLHTYCFVSGNGILKRKAACFFEYIHFERLIRWILNPQETHFDSLLSKEVVFQGEDYYAERIVNSAISFIKKGHPHNGIAFRGIRTGNCKYVLNALGEEYYYIINEDGTETLTPLEDDALRAELRSKSGTYFIDIRKYDKFKHSRKLYESILQDHPELGPPLWLAGKPEHTV